MNKRNIIIIAVSALIIIILLGIFWVWYQNYQKQKLSERAQRETVEIAKNHITAYGTYDANGNPQDYLDSFGQYLTPENRKSTGDTLKNNPQADQETRDYERSIYFKSKVKINSADLTFLADDLQTAEVKVKTTKTTTSTVEHTITQEEYTVFLVFQDNKWYVDHANLVSDNAPDINTPDTSTYDE